MLCFPQNKSNDIAGFICFYRHFNFCLINFDVMWKYSLIRENCNTFILLNSTILSISMHDIEKTDTAFSLHWYLTICFLVNIALHCISGTYLWGCSITLKMIFNSSDHSTIFITAPVLFTLTNCPTQEEKTQVLNRVTSFILKFKYRNKVW